MSQNISLPAELSGPRVLVFLTVDWSAYERISRNAFEKATNAITKEHPEIGVSTVVLNEDDVAVQQWLCSLNLPQWSGPCAIGSGSMFWLESGRMVDWEVNPGPLGWKRLLTRTFDLWGSKR